MLIRTTQWSRPRKFSIIIFLSFIACAVSSEAREQPHATVFIAVQQSGNQTNRPDHRALATQWKLRGQLGNKTIEMELRRESGDGGHVSGSYFYEEINRPLALRGAFDARGVLTLDEFDGQQKTGKFILQLSNDAEGVSPLAPISGKWTRPDGSRELDVSLNEQHILFASDLRFKTHRLKRRNVDAAYPQLVGKTAARSPGVAAFNRSITTFITKAVNEFASLEPPSGRSSYETEYRVMLAADDFVSVELSESSYAGGAYPNFNYYPFNHDLRTNRALPLSALFKPQSDYEQAILEYCRAQINHSYQEYKKENKEPNSMSEDEGDYLKSTADLPRSDNWAMTPRGIYMYFDFPHVAAVFNRVFVPFDKIQKFVDPQGPAAKYGAAP